MNFPPQDPLSGLEYWSEREADDRCPFGPTLMVQQQHADDESAVGTLEGRHGRQRVECPHAPCAFEVLVTTVVDGEYPTQWPGTVVQH